LPAGKAFFRLPPAASTFDRMIVNSPPDRFSVCRGLLLTDFHG
jgi:hypothetical protein